MGEVLLRAGLAALILYTMIPWVATRLLGWGVFRRGDAPQRIALTFDDGPDPAYTPQLLDVLQRHGVKATFFVLGQKAELHPGLIRRMHEEGHQIGIHNYTHLSNWLMAPWTVRRNQVDRTAAIVEAITGGRPTCYRPPWGVMNLFDFLLRKNYAIVLWSLTVRDWRRGIGAERLERRLLRKARAGAVVLLHDSGETLGADREAPAEMLKALDAAIAAWQRRGIAFARVDEMIPPAGRAGETLKRLTVRIWMLWEGCFLKLFRIVPVDGHNPLLRLRVRTYSGRRTLRLSDGEEIRKGDRVLELHLDNETLYRLGTGSVNTVHLAIQLIRGMEHLLPQIGRLVQTNPRFCDIKGLYGVSMIHRGAKQLGFTVIDLPKGINAWVAKLYLRLLLAVIHPRGRERLHIHAEKLVPKIIAISRKELIARYA